MKLELGRAQDQLKEKQIRLKELGANQTNEQIKD
jgi:hypothetical protein